MSGCFTCTRADNTLSSMTTVYWEILNSLLSPDVNIDHLNHANKELHLCEECMKLLESISEFRSMAAECVLQQFQHWRDNEDTKPCSIMVEVDEIDIKQERVSPIPDKPDIKQELSPVDLLATNGPECITCDIKIEHQDYCGVEDSEPLDDCSEAMEPDPLCEDNPDKPKKTDKNKGLKHAKTDRRKMNRRKRPYTHAILEEALEKIKSKELTLTEAGKAYSIPKTTLHYQLHGKTPLMLRRNDTKMQYLDNDGNQSSKKKRKARRKERLYAQGKLEEAVEKIRKDEITLTQASKTYDIPKTTLYSKLHGITPLVCKKGPDRMLSNDEERYIANWIADKIKSDGRIGVDEVKEAVARLFEERGLPRMKPGMKWYRLFRQRHRSYFLKQARTLEEIAKEGLERTKNSAKRESDSRTKGSVPLSK